MLRNLLKSRSGNFGILAALLMLPVLLACGIAVDYTNLSSLRSSLQNANDAAALIAAREVDDTGKLPKKDEVERTLRGNINTAATVLKLERKSDSVVLASRAQANLIFSGILPHQTSQVEVLSAVKIQGNAQLDVVLVLDNTGSMSADGKIGALKDAAVEFVHTLLSLNKNGRKSVRIGIVPFSNYVNVGMESRHAHWIWVPEDDDGAVTTEAGSYDQCQAWTTDYNNCHTYTNYNDGVATGTGQSCASTCTGGYSQVNYPAGTSPWSITWRGCVGSRGPYPDNVRDNLTNRPFIGLPAISGLSVPGFPSVSCPTPITALTTNENSLKASIGAMKATGMTYIATGVTWGLRVLSEAAPYTESANGTSAEKADGRKIMVLMTDGDNTRSPQVKSSLKIPPEIAAYADFSELPNPYNEGKDRALADQMTQEACQAVKNEKITLYSISFGNDISPSGKAVMQGCAEEGKFYDVSQVAEISKAFQAIGSSIASVRLTR